MRLAPGTGPAREGEGPARPPEEETMTLRLVNDNERAAIPCRIVTGHGPADVLVSVDGKP